MYSFSVSIYIFVENMVEFTSYVLFENEKPDINARPWLIGLFCINFFLHDLTMVNDW